MARIIQEIKTHPSDLCDPDVDLLKFSKLRPTSAIGESQHRVTALLLQPSLHGKSAQGDVQPELLLTLLNLGHQRFIALASTWQQEMVSPVSPSVPTPQEGGIKKNSGKRPQTVWGEGKKSMYQIQARVAMEQQQIRLN